MSFQLRNIFFILIILFVLLFAIKGVFSAGTATLCVIGTEVCNNGIDDDCDGILDCSDSNCTSNPVCVTGGGGSGTFLPPLSFAISGFFVTGQEKPLDKISGILKITPTQLLWLILAIILFLLFYKSEEWTPALPNFIKFAFLVAAVILFIMAILISLKKV